MVRRDIRRAVIVLLVLINFCSPTFADWRDGISAAAKGWAEQLQREAELERQLEQQKKLFEQQQQLELQRRQRQQDIERYQAEQERLRRVAAEQSKKREDEEAQRKATFTGTGFFVSTDGYLVTNFHVVADRTDLAIRDIKGKFYRAAVVASDKKNDLALLRVLGKFPALRIAQSDSVLKAQRVLTVGYPQISLQGNESKVTDGIISSFSGLRNDDDWFQISVPIQSGNSGGPLVTESGAVVGVVVATVNVAKFYSNTGSLPQNVNFAIKSKILLRFLEEQQIKNQPSFLGKTTIGDVDNATVLVIAKNGSIDVAFEIDPIKNTERERTRVLVVAEQLRLKREAEREATIRRDEEVRAAQAQKSKEMALIAPLKTINRFYEAGIVTNVYPEYGYIELRATDAAKVIVGKTLAVLIGNEVILVRIEKVVSNSASATLVKAKDVERVSVGLKVGIVVQEIK